MRFIPTTTSVRHARVRPRGRFGLEALEGRLLLATGQGVAFAPVEGRLFSGEVGRFAVPSGAGPAVAYSASIDWGDATASTPGVVVAAEDGSFSVRGSHPYSDDGLFTATITVAGPEVASLAITSRAAVADAPISASSATIRPVAGTPFTGTVASFVVDDPSVNPVDYRATITWGDGQVSSATISAESGAFRVTGTNTYAVARPYATEVTIRGVGGAEATTIGSAEVVSPSGLATGVDVAATENRPAVARVATFSVADTSLVAANFQATIAWGDGTTSAGVVAPASPPAGGFEVSGIHTYAEPGAYAVSATITGPSGLSLASVSQTTVADVAPTLRGTSVRPVASQPFTGVVASFTDVNPAARAEAFAAAITWGDGQSGPGTVVANASGGFDVIGSVVYRAQSSYTITVQVFDPADGSSSSVTSTAIVGGPLGSLGGGLAPGSDSGTTALLRSDGITNVNRPTFTGTAEPFAIVQVFALQANANPSVTRTLGQAVAGPDGVWSLVSGTLPDGSYTITASMTRPAGSPSAPIPLMITPLVIDTIAPRVGAVRVDRAAGLVTIALTEYGAGFNQASLSNPTNYIILTPRNLRGTFAVPESNPTIAGARGKSLAQTIRVAPEGGFRPGRYRIRVVSGGIADLAGNALDGERSGRFPTGNRWRGGSFTFDVVVSRRGSISTR